VPPSESYAPGGLDGDVTSYAPGGREEYSLPNQRPILPTPPPANAPGDAEGVGGGGWGWGQVGGGGGFYPHRDSGMASPYRHMTREEWEREKGTEWGDVGTGDGAEAAEGEGGGMQGMDGVEGMQGMEEDAFSERCVDV
jgi:hypothetical protein